MSKCILKVVRRKEKSLALVLVRIQTSNMARKVNITMQLMKVLTKYIFHNSHQETRHQARHHLGEVKIARVLLPNGGRIPWSLFPNSSGRLRFGRSLTCEFKPRSLKVSQTSHSPLTSEPTLQQLTLCEHSFGVFKKQTTQFSQDARLITAPRKPAQLRQAVQLQPTQL